MKKYIKPALDCSGLAMTCILQSSTGDTTSDDPMALDKNKKAVEGVAESKHVIFGPPSANTTVFSNN